MDPGTLAPLASLTLGSGQVPIHLRFRTDIRIDDLNSGIGIRSPDLLYIPEPGAIDLRLVYKPGSGPIIIPPPSQAPVTVSIGGYMVQLKPNRFETSTVNGRTRYRFVGTIRNVEIEATITALTNGRYRLVLKLVGVKVDQFPLDAAVMVDAGGLSGGIMTTATVVD
jgi:hypothetical protein